MRPAFLLCGLLATPLAAQDTLSVEFENVTCSADQRAAGSMSSPDAPDAGSWDRIEPPQLNVPISDDDFRPRAGRMPPYWAVLTFVVDTSGYADLCTVRVVRSNEPRWTTHVLQNLLRVRYRPAFENGRPRRLLVQQSFTFGGRRREGGGN